MSDVRVALRSAAGWTANQSAMEALYGAGNYYTTLESWEAGEQTNLVTDGDSHFLDIYDDWPSGLSTTTYTTLGGWTTGPSNTITLSVPDGERHNGTPESGFCFVHNGVNSVISVQTQYTVVDGLDVKLTSPYSSASGISLAQTNTMVRNTIVRRTSGSASAGFALHYAGTLDSSASRAENCAAIDMTYGFLSSSIGITRRCEVDNCVATGCTTGFNSQVSDSIRARNCVAYACTTGFGGAGTFESGSTNNASSDSTEPGSNPVTTDIVSGDFLDAANDDYHINTGSTLYEAGADLSSRFTTDIDGDTWATTWSIGFDQPAAAGGTPTLSSPGVIGVQATQATPQVTLTF